MTGLTAEQEVLVRRLLKERVPGREVRVFGSRVNGTPKTYSDLDLVVMGDGPVDPAVMALLREAFTESVLPFRVDVLDWSGLSPEFRAVIDRGYEIL